MKSASVNVSVDVLVSKTVEFLIQFSLTIALLNQSRVSRLNDSLWARLAAFCFGEPSFNLTSLLFSRWKRDWQLDKTNTTKSLASQSFETVSLKKPSMRKKNENIIYVAFKQKEWNECLGECTFVGNGRKGFKVSFLNLLSSKLQNKGVKCWLDNTRKRSCYNYFGKSAFWTGKSRCVFPECPCVFSSKISNPSIGTHGKVIVKVKILGVCSHGIRASKLKHCKEKQRQELGLLLSSIGCANTLGQIHISNLVNKLQNKGLLQFHASILKACPLAYLDFIFFN